MKCTLSGAICQGGQAIARQSGKLSFVCLDTNGGSVLLRLTAPSTEKWAVGEVLNASLKAWPTVWQVQVEVKGQVGQSLPASQEGTGNFDVRWHPPLFICCTPASVALFSPNRASLGTPPSSFTSGRLLWLYDYIWGFVWLCMYLHHSQLVPINNRAPV